MFLHVKQIIDFDVVIQKENLDDQQKNININYLKLRKLPAAVQFQVEFSMIKYELKNS